MYLSRATMAQMPATFWMHDLKSRWQPNGVGGCSPPTCHSQMHSCPWWMLWSSDWLQSRHPCIREWLCKGVVHPQGTPVFMSAVACGDPRAHQHLSIYIAACYIVQEFSALHVVMNVGPHHELHVFDRNQSPPNGVQFAQTPRIYIRNTTSASQWYCRATTVTVGNVLPYRIHTASSTRTVYVVTLTSLCS